MKTKKRLGNYKLHKYVVWAYMITVPKDSEVGSFRELEKELAKNPDFFCEDKSVRQTVFALNRESAIAEAVLFIGEVLEAGSHKILAYKEFDVTRVGP